MIGGALVLGLICARFLKSSERRRERQWSGQRGYDREAGYDRELGYTGASGYTGETGYGYGRSGVGETEIGRQSPSGTGGYGGFEGGGGYAGA
jgi:hypothetical protein